MNKPNLVDSKLIENLLNNTKNISGPSFNSLKSIKNISIIEILKTYWLLLFVIISVFIFIIYHHKKDKKQVKETFTNKKLKKRRKVDKYISDESLPPMQYPQQLPNIQMKPKEKSKCLTCGDHNHDHTYHENQYDDKQFVDESQYIEQVNYEQPAQFEQQIDTNYENQFYGQSITEDINHNNNNNIESFNSATIGNYVAF
jgi:hypothetical protein